MAADAGVRQARVLWSGSGVCCRSSAFEVGALVRLYRQDRKEFLVAIATFAGVVVLGMLVGILTAVSLSLALLIARIARPRAAVIGAVDDTGVFHELPHDQGMEGAAGVVVFRFDAPLFFANADYFVEQAIHVFDQAQRGARSDDRRGPLLPDRAERRRKTARPQRPLAVPVGACADHRSGDRTHSLRDSPRYSRADDRRSERWASGRSVQCCHSPLPDPPGSAA